MMIITKTSRINDIKVGNRFRKDLGDIDSLAESIQQIGLLHPIVINENNELVAGQRRIEAAKKLGWKEVPCTIVNISDLIKGEFQENTARKDFTFSERQAILEEIERRRIGHRVSKERVADLQPFEKDNKGKKSVEIVSEYTGISPRQLSKEKAIAQAVKEKPHLEYIVKKIDSGEISVNEADETIKYLDDDSKKLSDWFELREEVLKAADNKCEECGSELHLDVYTIEPYHDKDKLENLETLCKDCHELKMKFADSDGLTHSALVKSFLYMFQKLTGLSGKKYFQYRTTGGNVLYDMVTNRELSDSDNEMKDNPYVKLKRSSDAELVSKTREHRKQLMFSDFSGGVGEMILYDAYEVLQDLLPILNDFL